MSRPGLELETAPAPRLATPAVPARLQAAFDALDAAGVSWCLLRGEDELADAGGDVDLLVDADAFSRAREALAAVGFAWVSAPGRGPHRFFVGLDAGGAWLKLDIVTELVYGPFHELPTRAAKACLGRRTRSGSLWLPSPRDSFWTLLLHALLDRRGDAKSRPRLAAKAEAAGAGPPHELLRLLRPEDAAAAARLAATGQVMNGLADRVRAGLPLSMRLAATRRRTGNRLLRGLARRSPVAGRRGLVVALLGPDGAGKSSLAGALEHAFPVRADRAYAGMYARAPKRRFAPSYAVRIARSVRLGLSARLTRARGGIAVLDRHPYDALLPPAKPCGRGRRLRRRLLAGSCVRPDLLLILDAPAEVLAGRTDDHAAAELDRQREAYRSLAARLPNVVLVDARPEAAAVLREAIGHVWQRYAEVGAGR